MDEEEGAKISKYFTYPKDGTKKTIPVGDTKIDFRQGEISLPDGTTDELLSSLRQEEKEWIRSVFIETNKDIKVWLDNGSLAPVAEDDFIIIPHTNFKVLWIRATEATEIDVWASTDPKGAIKKTKAEGAKAVITRSGDYVVISGDLTATVTVTTDISGQFAYFATRSGDYVVVSGEVRLPSSQAVKISGETVKISGEKVFVETQSGQVLYTHISGYVIEAHISGDLTASISGQPVKVSGEVVYVTTRSGDYVVISGDLTATANVSGQPVGVSGETVYVITRSGDYVVISGDFMATANISGQTTYVLTHSGDYVVVSGEVQLPSTQAVKISGETVIAKTSGDVAKISGEIVDIKTPTSIFTGARNVIGAISGGVALISGDVVSVTVKADSDNSGDIYLGGNAGSMMPYSGYGFKMTTTENISLDVDNPNKIKCAAQVSGDILWIIGVK